MVKMYAVYKKSWFDGFWYRRAIDLTEERALKQIANEKRREPDCKMAMVQQYPGEAPPARYVGLPMGAERF